MPKNLRIPVDMIEQNQSNRFVSDNEKLAWNDKADANHSHDLDQINNVADWVKSATKPVYRLDEIDGGKDIQKEVIRIDSMQKELEPHTKLEKVCIYYGYPSGIGGSWTVKGAVEIYKQYDICVFGDTYEIETHEAYSETVETLATLKQESPDTKIVGYVPIGVKNVGSDSGLSMEELKKRVLLWKKIGANGIFLDEFGYDYGVTRERQNEIVNYVHSQDMFCIANSWNQAYVFSSQNITVSDLKGFDPNPSKTLPVINENDYSLLENMFYSCIINSDKSVTLKSASCWRIDDGYAYYSRTQEEYGMSFYNKFKTKLLQLDAIPSSLNATEKNTLMTMSIIGAKIFNIPAVAFGDENWGSSGYYYTWDIPTAIDLSENLSKGIHGVEAAIKGESDDSFPYKWIANVNGNQLSLVFDVDSGNDETWDSTTHYVTVNDVKVYNAWQTIYEFQDVLKEVQNQSNESVKTVNTLKSDVENAMPTVTNAERKINEIITDATTKLENASKTVESALADVAGVTNGFGFKEVQW